MLARGLNEVCASSIGCEHVYPQINRALHASMRVVSQVAGLDMNEVGAMRFAPEYTNPFPDVELAA